jgi:hypothetical protein
MKKLFASFKISDDEKITEKSFTFNIVASVVGVLLCLTSLTAATWAWFGDSVTSPVNEVQSGQYLLDVSVMKQGSSEAVAPKPVSTDPNKLYKLDPGEYVITLTGGGNVTTGYCKVEFGGNEKPFYSEQVFTDESTKTESEAPRKISFVLKVEGAAIDVSFSALWGTYSSDERDFVNNNTYVYNGQLTSGTESISADNGSETNGDVESTDNQIESDTENGIESNAEAASQTDDSI